MYWLTVVRRNRLFLLGGLILLAWVSTLVAAEEPSLCALVQIDKHGDLWINGQAGQFVDLEGDDYRDTSGLLTVIVYPDQATSYESFLEVVSEFNRASTGSSAPWDARYVFPSLAQAYLRLFAVDAFEIPGSPASTNGVLTPLSSERPKVIFDTQNPVSWDPSRLPWLRRGLEPPPEGVTISVHQTEEGTFAARVMVGEIVDRRIEKPDEISAIVNSLPSVPLVLLEADRDTPFLLIDRVLQELDYADIEQLALVGRGGSGRRYTMLQLGKRYVPPPPSAKRLPDGRFLKWYKACYLRTERMLPRHEETGT